MKTNLRYYREKAYLQIKELAPLAGVSVQYISNIENERANPSFPMMRKIAKALNVPVEDVFPRDQSRIIQPNPNAA